VARIDSSAIASAKVDDPGRDDGARAADRKKAARSAKMLGDFGDYELLEEIGRGGQGVVYRAHQKSLNRTVALKVIGLGYWATEAHLKRFRREAEAAARLDHSGIVPIYEVGEREGSCYFSMKFVDGGQLDEVMKSATADSSCGEREPMPVRRPVELIAKVARTVHYAHEHGILHRDIKPGNILLDHNWEPHLTDFGLARLVEAESTITGTLEVLGTPSYMAPEQARGNLPQGAAVSSPPNDSGVMRAIDVYGLGAVLYHLLTGQPPFAGGTTYETVKLLLETEPRQPRVLNPKVDRDLSAICLKCLEKDPKRRYSSALALAEDLEHWLKHEPIHAKRSGFLTHARKWVRRKPAIAALIASLVALAAAMGWNVWKGEFVPLPPTTAPEKSIAVLPFENLSEEKANAIFADGVQDDILTKLAKVADLKVISRTSVMQYRGKQDLRQIGRLLRVSHVLEGTVRRAGENVHVNAQLVDTRTDTHVWAEEYDRDLSEVFAIETELAQSIANRLRAKVSVRERMAMQERPTSDLIAFDLYTRAKNLVLTASGRSTGRTDLLQAVGLLNEALARDPLFLQAYCQLASANEHLYSLNLDRTSARLALAEAAIEAAFRLRPDAGEAHLAHAENLYRGYQDYRGALTELEVARQSLPNDARVFQLMGFIQRRQGRWEEATQNLERAVELDPANTYTLQQMAWQYLFVRRYAEVKPLLARMLAIEPNRVDAEVFLASLDFHWKGDIRPFHRMIDAIRTTNPSALPAIADAWLTCALAERDAGAAANAMAAVGENAFGDDTVQFSRTFVEGLVARMMKDENKARSAFTAARSEEEKIVQAQPNYGPPLCVLGLIDAALGRKEDALREGRRAVELLPVEKDAINGARTIKYSAMIAAWAGDKDLACEQLAIAIHYPSSFSYGELRLLPFWDPLRGDSRFEEIVASLAPKEN
jgi:serine/threonine protein kinase/tetratricopeptide (TPR) repeat protein